MLRIAWRYGMSTAGPVAVSGAHFLASLVFLRNLQRTRIRPVRIRHGGCFLRHEPGRRADRGAHHPEPGQRRRRHAARLLPHELAGVRHSLSFWRWRFGVSEAPLREALLLGGYAAAFAWRWFARSLAYVDGRVHAAIASDIVYSLMLVTSLPTLALGHRMTFTHGSEVMLLAALAALAPFGWHFFSGQFAALRRGSLLAYLPVFSDVSRWSMVGVIFTEITVNIHAYLVTFISGAGSFALLALGMLLMRPASLVQSALPDMERPAMARAIAKGDLSGLGGICAHLPAWPLRGLDRQLCPVRGVCCSSPIWC